MRPDDDGRVVTCAGVPIVACTPREAAEAVLLAALSLPAAGRHVHLCNAYTLALADADASLRDVLVGGGVNYPDGKSVVWANRWSHRGADLPKHRVYGPDLMLDVVRLGEPFGLRHFLLGSTDDVLSDLEIALRTTFPSAQIVGRFAPPFRPLDEQERLDQRRMLEVSGAHVVWVGLGTPKQDFEVARLASEVAAVHVAVGAAFDFISGHKRQAPAWVGRSGLEWLYRWASEPRRLSKRYAWGNARFLALIGREWTAKRADDQS